MKKKTKWLFFLTAVLLFIILEARAQSIKRQSIGSYGGANVTDEVYIGYTIGQPYFASFYGKNTPGIASGFQQPLTYHANAFESFSVFNSPSVFPNPASLIFSIKSPEILENTLIQVTDLNGKLILSDEVQELHNYPINCSHWKNGLYVITISDKQKQNIYMTKVIISK